MPTVSATEAKKRIGQLWRLAETEPVTIERNGVPKYQIISTDRYVAVPLEVYARLCATRRAPRFGFARHLLLTVDTDALLKVDITGGAQPPNDEL